MNQLICPNCHHDVDLEVIVDYLLDSILDQYTDGEIAGMIAIVPERMRLMLELALEQRRSMKPGSLSYHG